MDNVRSGFAISFFCSIHNVVMKYISVKSNVNRQIENAHRKPEFCAFTLLPLPTKTGFHKNRNFFNFLHLQTCALYCIL